MNNFERSTTLGQQWQKKNSLLFQHFNESSSDRIISNHMWQCSRWFEPKIKWQLRNFGLIETRQIRKEEIHFEMKSGFSQLRRKRETNLIIFWSETKLTLVSNMHWNEIDVCFKTMKSREDDFMGKKIMRKYG